MIVTGSVEGIDIGVVSVLIEGRVPVGFARVVVVVGAGALVTIVARAVTCELTTGARTVTADPIAGAGSGTADPSADTWEAGVVLRPAAAGAPTFTVTCRPVVTTAVESGCPAVRIRAWRCDVDDESTACPTLTELADVAPTSSAIPEPTIIARSAPSAARQRTLLRRDRSLSPEGGAVVAFGNLITAAFDQPQPSCRGRSIFSVRTRRSTGRHIRPRRQSVW